MMLTPCGPRAVPTGGAGVAPPAWSCTLTSAAIFFLGGIPLSLPSCGHDERSYVALPLLLLFPPCGGACVPALLALGFDTLNPTRCLTGLASSPAQTR